VSGRLHFHPSALLRPRALAALAAVALGIGALFTIRSLAEVVRNETLSGLTGTYADVVHIQFAAASASSDASGGTLSPEEFVPRLEPLLPVATRLSRHLEARHPVLHAGKSLRSRVVGVDHDFFSIFTADPRYGRTLGYLDRNAPVALVGAGEARTLAGPENIEALIGTVIQIADSNFTIVGVLAPTDWGGNRKFSPDDALLVPANTFLRRFPAENESHLVLAADTPGDAQSILSTVAAMPGTKGLRTSSLGETRARIAARLRNLTLFFATLGGLAFVLGTLGLLGFLASEWTAREPELALRRALGASRRQIRTWFIFDALWMSTIASQLGVIAGFGFAHAVARLNTWSVEPSTGSFLAAAVVAWLLTAAVLVPVALVSAARLGADVSTRVRAT
jgi:putative ABC transport system permease protein